MAENASEEELRRTGKKKEKEYNATRLLYNETPSDDERHCLDGKKSKNKHVEQKEPSPKRVKTNFSKVWSDEDEISLLKGMINFKKEKDRDVAKNMVEFHPFILQSLVLQATRVQLREKVRQLRIKYENSGNASTTPHERRLFQLCDKIWTTEQPNSSTTGQLNHNIPQIAHNILEIGRPIQHNMIPITALNVETLEALDGRIREDIELVLNSKACLQGTKWDVDLKRFDLCAQSFGLSLKLVTLVREKANSPELRDSPELLEQEVIRAYLEAKIEHAQLLSNAYNSFIKAPPKKVDASSSKNGVAAKKKDESDGDSSSGKDGRSEEEVPPKKVVASSSKNGVAAKKKDESDGDSSSEKDRRSEEEDHSDEA